MPVVAVVLVFVVVVDELVAFMFLVFVVVVDNGIDY